MRAGSTPDRLPLTCGYRPHTERDLTTPSSAERPVLDIEQFISGPPDAVFEAWLDPEQLKL